MQRSIYYTDVIKYVMHQLTEDTGETYFLGFPLGQLVFIFSYFICFLSFNFKFNLVFFAL